MSVPDSGTRLWDDEADQTLVKPPEIDHPQGRHFAEPPVPEGRRAESDPILVGMMRRSGAGLGVAESKDFHISSDLQE
jgi:hypothetical protein